jgi:endonuclease YncB( thermonuclease family)
MSKHWQPDAKKVRLRPAPRKWTKAQAYWRAPTAPSLSGTTVGAVLFAAACAGISFGWYQAMPPPVANAPKAITSAVAATGTVAQFGFCHNGGGTNCVVDGDTFYVNGDKVRIAGIDTPETHPPRCAEEARLGEAATEKLHALLNSGAVTMTSVDRDRDTYGRLLRNVQVDGADVGEALIADGVAREYGSGRRGWC